MVEGCILVIGFHPLHTPKDTLKVDINLNSKTSLQTYPQYRAICSFNAIPDIFVRDCICKYPLPP